MTKMKRLMCLLMVALMVFSLTACGDDSGDKDDKKAGTEVQVDDVSDIFSAVELASQYTKGNYKAEISFDMDIDGTAASGSLNMSGKKDGNNATVSLGIDVDASGTSVAFSADDILTVSGDKAYIALDPIMKAVSGVDTKFGSFPVPMPEIDEKAQADAQAKASEVSIGLLKASFKDIEVSKSGNTYTIEVKTAEEFLSVLKGAVNYLAENQDAVNEIVNSESAYDVNEYLNTLAEFYRDDLKSAGELIGMEITDEMIDEIVEELAATADLSGTVGDVDLFEGVDFDEIKASLDAVSADDIQEEFEAAGMVLKFSVTAESDKYVVDFNVAMDEETIGKIDITAKYTFETDSSVFVSAPSDETSITGVIEYISENPDLLEEISTGLEAFAELLY